MRSFVRHCFLSSTYLLWKRRHPKKNMGDTSEIAVMASEDSSLDFTISLMGPVRHHGKPRDLVT